MRIDNVLVFYLQPFILSCKQRHITITKLYNLYYPRTQAGSETAYKNMARDNSQNFKSWQFQVIQQMF
jgi:hypothetical protein